MVRDDCARRLDELGQVQPTIVFDAKDASGRDVAAVKVTVDGRPLAEKLDGAALAVDPGEHTFVFTVAGGALVTQTFVIREGQKARYERIVLGGPASGQQIPVAPTAAIPASSLASAPAVVEAAPARPSPASAEKPAASGSPGRTGGLGPRGRRPRRNWGGHGLRAGGALDEEQSLLREHMHSSRDGEHRVPTGDHFHVGPHSGRRVGRGGTRARLTRPRW